MVVEGNDGGILSCRRAFVCLLFTTILCSWNATAAHAQYVQRQIVTTNGAITFVGNSLGLNKDGTNDRPGASGSLGTFITTDTNQQESPEWPHGTTGDWRLNSSSAVVSLLSGSRVIHAELIWGGSYLFGSEDVSAFLNDPINFTTPAGTTQVTRDPTTAVTRSGPQQNYYARTANVTTLVTAAGNGTYTVGRVPATQATDEANFNAAGWTLAILYENSDLPTRRLSLFLGLEPQGGATASVLGICTPDSNGQLRARVAVSAVEGDTNDPNDTRDSLRFGPSSNLNQNEFRLSGPNNPAGNFFASQINRDDGKLDTSGTFGDRNNDFRGRFDGGREGWDITNVDASAQLTRQQTAAFAQGTAEFDDFFINALAMQIDVAAPGFWDARDPTRVNRSAAEVGDVLTYTVDLDNKSGFADANSVVLTVPLPAGMSFVAGSFMLDGTPTGANPITGAAIGTVAVNARREVTFQLRVDAIPAAPAPARYQVTPTWTYTFVGCAGQTPQSGAFTSNTVTTEIARITAAKSASAPSIRPEEILTYTVTISNSGTAASRGTLVRDAIPTGTTYQPSSTTLNGSAVADLLGTSQLVVGMLVNSPLVSPGIVRPGESAVVKFRVRVDSSATTSVVNTATIEPDGIFGPLPVFPVSVTTPITSFADLSVSKTGPVTAIAGANVTYTVTVLNAGPGAANAVTLTDPVPLGLTLVSVTGACTTLPCSLGTLADDETRTVSVTYSIPANYPLGNTIVNTATVTTTSQDTFPDNNSASASTAIGAPVADLMITNTNGVSGVVVGTTTTYTITVTNAGPSTAANAVVTDTFPAALTGVSWSCAGAGGAVCGTPGGAGHINATVTVPVSSTLTFTATGTIDPASTGTIVNTARVVPAAGTSDPTPAIATDSDPVELRADLSVTETGPTTVVAGNNIAYTLTVNNAGPSAAADVLLEDLVPEELTFVSATGPCTAFPCSLGTLAPGVTVSAQITYAVPAIYLPDTVVSTARVSSSTVDPNESNNTSTTTATVDRRADVEVIKLISPDTTSLLGEDATFFVTVTNHGPAPATGVVVSDLLPAGLTLVSAHVSQGSYVPQTGLWTAGTLEDEAFATLTLIATLTVADSIRNLAQVLRQNEPDPVPSNNFSAAVLNGQENADVGVDIAVDKPAPLVGENVTFTVTVANRGPSSATGVVVADLLSSGLTLVSGTPSQGTFVAPDWTIGTLSEIAPPVTLTIVATVTASGPLFTAAAISQQTEADSNPANNRASVTLNAAESANLKVIKSLTRSSPHVGELLTFNVTVANQGPSSATGIQVTEVLSAGLAFESAVPSQGAYDVATGIWAVGSIGNAGSAGLTITARVTQAGTVTNTASVTASDQPDPDPADNTSSVTLTTETIADLAITKTLTGTAIPGLATTYTIVVTNTGPSPVTAASVSDLFPVALVAPAWTCTADPGSSCAAASGTGNLATTVTLEAGDRATVIVTGLIAANATGLLDNTATVAAAGAVDPDPANNTATSSVTLTPSADLQITKAGPANALAGTNVVYTITVTNAGPSDATSVTLADPTPPGLTFVANTGDCMTAFPCDLGTLPPAATRTITVTFAIPPGYITPDPIENTATVSSTTPDPAAGNNSAIATTSLAAPVTDLHITKTNGVDGVVAGLPTTYTIIVTNPLGPSDATGATVTDMFPAMLTGVTWSCAGTGGGICVPTGNGHINTPVTVPVGASVVFTASGTVNPAATGELVNSAQVRPPAGHANRTSAIATDRDAIGSEADVAITKTGPASIIAGNPLVYTITVTNNGPSDAANVVVRDPTPPGLTWVSTTGACTTLFPCTLGVLPSGTQTITATFTVPPDYSGPSPIENVADVSSATVDPVTTNNVATAVTTLNRQADVEVTKTVPSSSVLVGDEILVTINALNHGPNPATGIEVTDSLPAGFDFVSASASQGAYDPATGAWSVGSLAVGETAQLVLTAKVTAPGVITNLAVKTGQNEPDPIVGNDAAAAGTTATPAADLEVDKEVDRHDVLLGETVTFTVRATNRGPSPATGVTIADRLPSGLPFISDAPSQGSYDTFTGIWTVGALDSAAQATLTLVARAVGPGALVNNASVASQDQIDPNPTNNSDAASINAAPAADLRVAKAVSDTAPGVGALVTYTIAVTNLGPSDATSADVSDVLPAGVAFVLARASQGTYDSGTGIWTLGAVPATRTEILRLTGRITEPGTLVNTATRQSSTPVDPNAANDTGTATLTSSVVADLSLTKTPSAPAAAAGTSFTWTIAVVNNGPSTAVGASVTDSFPVEFTGVTWTCTASSGSLCTSPSGTGTIAATVDLLAGGSATFVATGISAPVGSSQLVNVATVAAAAGTTDPDLSNNSDTSAVGLVPLADVQVTQAGPSFLAPGTSGDYLITIANVGPSRTESTTLMMPTPDGSLVPVTVSGACSSLPCALGELAPGEVREVIATLSPPADYAGPPTLIVRAVADGAPFDPLPVNNAATVVTTVTPLADLSITKTGPATAVPGEQVTYAVTVANAGPSIATGVTVEDPTPAGLTLMSTSGDCTTAFPCDLGTMAPGTTRTIAATYTVGTAAPPEITNAATVLSGISDPNPANNSATISTTIRIRTTCDVDGDGLNEIITGAGPRGGPHVRVLKVSGGTVTELAGFFAYDPKFVGGVFVACGDVTGDGLAEVITGAGPGGGPHVRAFSLAGGTPTEVASFFAYDPAFLGGVTVAAADLTGDGVAEIITGAGPGGGPHVRAFSLGGGTPTEVTSFFAYDPAYLGGVSVAAGDVTGDGVAEIITGAGPGGGPHVRAFSLAGSTPTEVASFFAYDPAYLGGVTVAAGDVTGDGVAEIITGAGPGGGPHVRAFSLGGGTTTEVASFFAYDPAFLGGVTVAAADLTGDGVAEIITGAGAGGGPHVRAFSLAGGTPTEVASFFAYDPAFPGGVNVASAALRNPRHLDPAVLEETEKRRRVKVRRSKHAA